ncbi:MAG TPA: hypothetical protein VFG10_03615 [Saprospiraceae bacterium]|nr:hypothetical protein [Saprospiraceae bacterium]
MEYKQFNVYSKEIISEQIKPILDSALSLVATSELYDSTYRVDLFLSYNTFLNQIDDMVFGQGVSAKALDNNLVFKANVDVNENRVHATFHKSCHQRFDYMIAHELMHCLQAHKYGLLKFNPFTHLEMWKLEGYPEYVARQKFSESTDSLKMEIKRFIELHDKQTDIWILLEEGGCEVPEFYYKGRLMTEYLMNAKGMTYDQILKDKRSEEEIYIEMTGWVEK